MAYKPKYKNKSERELAGIAHSWKMNYKRIRGLLDEYKVTILLQNRQIDLLRKKLDFLEGKINKRTYHYLGPRHNRDIGTLKRRNKKSMEERRRR